MKSHYCLGCVSFFAVIQPMLLDTVCSVYIEAIRHGESRKQCVCRRFSCAIFMQFQRLRLSTRSHEIALNINNSVGWVTRFLWLPNRRFFASITIRAR